MRAGKADVGLMMVLFLLSFLPWLCLAEGAGEALYADITLEGRLYRRVWLSGHQGREEIELRTEQGSNFIVVEDEGLAVMAADCPDKICVQAGRLSEAGDTAACLPHGLLIEVKGGTPGKDETIMIR